MKTSEILICFLKSKMLKNGLYPMFLGLAVQELFFGHICPYGRQRVKKKFMICDIRTKENKNNKINILKLKNTFFSKYKS